MASSMLSENPRSWFRKAFWGGLATALIGVLFWAVGQVAAATMLVQAHERVLQANELRDVKQEERITALEARAIPPAQITRLTQLLEAEAKAREERR